MNKNKIISIGRIIISLGLVALLLYLARDNFTKVWQLLRSVNVGILACAYLFFILSTVLIAYRLRLLLVAQEAWFSMQTLFPLTLIGYFFSNFMPTSVGGDLVKGYFIGQRMKNKTAAYAAIFVDRTVGMFSLACIACAALILMRAEIKHAFIFWAVILLFSTCLLFIILLLNKNLAQVIGRRSGLRRILQIIKLDALLKKAYFAINLYHHHQDRLIQSFLLSAVAQFSAFFSVYLLSCALGATVSFDKILLIMPIVGVLCMLPVAMNGLGLREWAFVFFLSASIGAAAALSLSILYLALFLITGLIGGVIYLFWR
ncbi:MAG: flippase-like domain-containing protein [Candidatus Omnitrophica bacterium]|nr:flippase-like domain-containing protein [Candidatus Omnitrophota bacterium]